MRHKDTIGLYNYWNEIRADRDAPLRSDVAPAGLGRLLPAVMLLDHRDDGEIVFRLAGTRLCSLRCTELRGKLFSDMFRHADRLALVKILHSVQNQKSLAILDVVARRRDGSSIRVEIALFPLDDETTPIIGIMSVGQMPYWFGVDPAELEIRGIRHMDPRAELMFLQNRPSIMIQRDRDDAETPRPVDLHVVGGKGLPGPTKALRAFRVLDGGKK